MLKNLFIVVIFVCASYAEDTTGVPISAEILVQIQNNVHIVDFRGDEARDLDGFIEGSVAIPVEMTDEIKQTLQ